MKWGKVSPASKVSLYIFSTLKKSTFLRMLRKFVELYLSGQVIRTVENYIITQEERLQQLRRWSFFFKLNFSVKHQPGTWNENWNEERFHQLQRWEGSHQNCGELIISSLIYYITTIILIIYYCGSSRGPSTFFLDNIFIFSIENKYKWILFWPILEGVWMVFSRKYPKALKCSI